jgi:16S rRNA (guanine(966)-N(2))-methyltransferase RsmD
VSGPLDGCTVLDLFAGSGNLGIEALSRGAAEAVFIDSARDAAAIIARNLESTGFRERGLIVSRDFRSAITSLESADRRFGLIFIDPPYRKGLVEKALNLLSQSTLLEDGAVVIAEFYAREELGEDFGRLHRIDERSYGDTALAFFITTERGVTCQEP